MNDAQVVTEIETLRKTIERRRQERSTDEAKIEMIEKQLAELEKESNEKFGVGVKQLPELAEKMESDITRMIAETKRDLGMA